MPARTAAASAPADVLDPTLPAQARRFARPWMWGTGSDEDQLGQRIALFGPGVTGAAGLHFGWMSLLHGVALIVAAPGLPGAWMVAKAASRHRNRTRRVTADQLDAQGRRLLTRAQGSARDAVSAANRAQPLTDPVAVRAAVAADLWRLAVTLREHTQLGQEVSQAEQLRAVGTAGAARRVQGQVWQLATEIAQGLAELAGAHDRLADSITVDRFDDRQLALITARARHEMESTTGVLAEYAGLLKDAAHELS